ncbi:periplasmic nitrate reductase, NapE protein [Gilvimarinus agarilyticus]|uniref:periplasmic nitrate reductase, NapE protein n=1 Tax=Gilvimarinus agarilyticus TaxID=679259 RepID=UPI00059FB709|nr:periplasmic nitrate reductase, NapE protein [Gilvimarinus agarilyticus]
MTPTQELKLQPENEQKRREWRLFIFIIVFLFPLLSVAIVGGYGFTIWMYQILAGPPGAG